MGGGDQAADAGAQLYQELQKRRPAHMRQILYVRQSAYFLWQGSIRLFCFDEILLRLYYSVQQHNSIVHSCKKAIFFYHSSGSAFKIFDMFGGSCSVKKSEIENFMRLSLFNKSYFAALHFGISFCLMRERNCRISKLPISAGPNSK